MKTKTVREILHEVSPGEQQRALKASQQQIHAQLTELTSQLNRIAEQLERQSDSTFGGKSWREAGHKGFGSRLIVLGRLIVALGEKFNSGELPRWARPSSGDAL